MTLFNKKKLSLEEILKAIEGLSEEEKAEIKAKMDEKPESEEEVKAEETTSETEENGVETQGELEEYNDFEEGEEIATEETNTEEPAVEEPATEETEQPVEPVVTESEQAQDNSADVLQGLTDRVSALEDKLAQLNELKELMENFTQKQADSIGYKGAIPGAKKDIQDMSARELKEKMLNGEI